MLVVIPLQDWLAVDETLRAPDPAAERINIPAHSRHYWRYRMPVLIEELLCDNELTVSLRGMVDGVGRG
jgi:4-alpha-glucanotransferase